MTVTAFVLAGDRPFPARALGAGRSGPSVRLVRTDFPTLHLAAGVGYDGQQYYAVARALPSVASAARYLDSPRYRLQRIGFAVLARALYPPGRGPGLLWAFSALGVAGVLAACVALGLLARELGGNPRWAAFGAIAPGATVSRAASLPDVVAAAAALWTLLAMSRERWWAATALFAFAGLTRETTLLVPLALLAATRDRRLLPAALVPAGVAGAWATADSWQGSSTTSPACRLSRRPFRWRPWPRRSRWRCGHCGEPIRCVGSSPPSCCSWS